MILVLEVTLEKSLELELIDRKLYVFIKRTKTLKANYCYPTAPERN